MSLLQPQDQINIIYSKEFFSSSLVVIKDGDGD